MKICIRKYYLFSLYALVPFLLVDMINGYFIINGNSLPLSATYKAFLCIIFTLPLIKSAFILYALILSLIVVLYQTISFPSGVFFFDLSAILKTMIFFVMFYGFYLNRSFLTHKHRDAIVTVVRVNFAILVLNIYAGLLGFGYTTYGSHHVDSGAGVGFKGFFFAGNELGALLICILPLTYYSLSNRRNSFYVIAFVMSSLLAAILLGTKTAIAGVFIFSTYKLVSFYKYKALLVLPPLLLVFSLYLYEHIILLSSALTERISFFLGNHGWDYVIFSGRDEFVFDIYELVISNFSIFDLLLGVGPNYLSTITKPAEVDFVDLLVSHGLIWLVTVYSVVIAFSIFVVKLSNSKGMGEFSISIFILAFVSIFAGHALTSAMLLPFLALYYPFLHLKDIHESRLAS